MEKYLLKHNAEGDIPKLLENVEKLIEFTQGILQTGIEIEENDHFAIIAHGFVCKQLDHLKSIQILVKAGHHMDAIIISRSMIEGLCILLWIAEKRDERSIDYRTFGWIDEYRHTCKMESIGFKIDPNYKLSLEKELKVFGHRFYTAQAKDLQRQDKPLPRNPYLPRPSWENISKTCEEVKRSLTYLLIYYEASQWVHWTTDGMDMVFHRDGDKATYSCCSYRSAATALANGFESLIRSAKLLDSHLDLHLDKRLTEIEMNYHTSIFVEK
jgi:hypothetical protein